MNGSRRKNAGNLLEPGQPCNPRNPRQPHGRILLALVMAAIMPAALVACTAPNRDTPPTASITTATSTARPTPDRLRPDPSSTTAGDTASASTTAASRASQPLADRVIYLDPGHAGTPPPPDLQVPDGRGGSKSCNTAGTASYDGFAEHEFNWLLAQEIRALLLTKGATVLLSRADDSGRADCIDVRAEKENASGADAVLSLHADGAAEGNRGFHISAISEPLPGNDVAASTALAHSLRDALLSAGFTPSNYLGEQGLFPRADLAGLNLSTRPKVLVEYGNMRDGADVEILASAEGRRRLAEATVAGVVAFLGATGLCLRGENPPLESSPRRAPAWEPQA